MKEQKLAEGREYYHEIVYDDLDQKVVLRSYPASPSTSLDETLTLSYSWSYWEIKHMPDGIWRDLLNQRIKLHESDLK